MSRELAILVLACLLVAGTVVLFALDRGEGAMILVATLGPLIAWFLGQRSGEKRAEVPPE